MATRVTLAALLVAVAASAAAPAGRSAAVPRLLDLRVGNGSTPFAGDRRLLTTVSPNGDRFRDKAIVRFRLDAAATVELDVVQTLNVKRGQNTVRTILTQSYSFQAGPHRLAWTPTRTIPNGTYVLELTVIDGQGRKRVYNDLPLAGHVQVAAPVVRIQRVGVSIGPRYMPGQTAAVSIATDARRLELDVLSFRIGTGVPDARTAARPIAPPVELSWRGHRNAPGKVRIRIGDWPSGLYFVRVRALDGRIGYAPFVVRPRVLGLSRVAIVVPTNTWQAYNFEDANGDGWGDSWYVNGAFRTVDIQRPYVDYGVPYRFGDFDAAIQGWLAGRGNLDYLTDLDLEHVKNADTLAAKYDLIVFPGHEEYVTAHEFDLIRRYRDLGGNLMFLSANNLFWKVVFHGHVMRRVGQWRAFGQPEAAIVGVQYVASNYGAQQAPYIADTTGAPWAFAGTGLATGVRFGRYGYEIDMRSPASPPGTIVLGSAPDLMGPGKTAEMTYYETPKGAKVFAGGALNFAASVTDPAVERLLENVWARLSRP
ncbi:MAG: N,N-dimethylformamidase beta subunit family domain-containing protein [Gaiellaceae bacterium]